MDAAPRTTPSPAHPIAHVCRRRPPARRCRPHWSRTRLDSTRLQRSPIDSFCRSDRRCSVAVVGCRPRAGSVFFFLFISSPLDAMAHRQSVSQSVSRARASLRTGTGADVRVRAAAAAAWVAFPVFVPVSPGAAAARPCVCSLRIERVPIRSSFRNPHDTHLSTLKSLGRFSAFFDRSRSEPPLAIDVRVAPTPKLNGATFTLTDDH